MKSSGAPTATRVASVFDYTSAVNYEASVKALRSAEAKLESAKIALQMAKDQLQASTAQVEAVNKTLQTEAMGGSWLQRNHHAIESMFTCGLVGCIYFILPLLKIPVPAVPEAAWLITPLETVRSPTGTFHSLAAACISMMRAAAPPRRRK